MGKPKKNQRCIRESKKQDLNVNCQTELTSVRGSDNEETRCDSLGEVSKASDEGGSNENAEGCLAENQETLEWLPKNKRMTLERRLEEEDKKISELTKGLKEAQEIITRLKCEIKERDQKIAEFKQCFKNQDSRLSGSNDSKLDWNSATASTPKEEVEESWATVKGSATGSSCQPSPPGPATHIHQLPDDVLEKIFALLSLKTIGKQLSVCRHWHDVIEDRKLIKRLAFKDLTVSTEEARCLIHSSPKLKSLDLFRRYDTLALLDAASNRCTNLLHLSVHFWKASVPLTEVLKKVFQANPHITNLCLIYISTSEDLRFYQELGGLLPDLCKLQFHIGRLSHLQLDALMEGCSHNQMEEFKALFSPRPNTHIAKLVQVWGRSLQVLELWAAKLTDRGLALLAGCSELRRLKLESLCTYGNGLCSLAPLSHLEELYMSHATLVTQENWCLFFSQSRSSYGLRKLSFQGRSKVDDRVLVSVAAFCPQLEELEVASVNVTIFGVREVLQCCRKLHNLVIFNTEASLLVLPKLPQLAPQLRRIRISHEAKCSLDEATLNHVQAQMPHLTIE